MTCVLDSCNQGREPCPDPAVCCGRARRQEAEYLWTRELGVEAADAPRVTGLVPPIVTTELRPVRWAIDWQGVVIYGGVAVCMFALAWLSTADPRDLSSFWPRVLAALSF